MRERWTWAALAAILLLGLALRLYDIRNPILDHPAWRQGDEAAIARNFAQLENNLFRPQVDYGGPPPNYAELELQVVPYAAAQFYRVTGVHEIFGRLLVVAFSLAAIVLLFAFGTQLFSQRAGLLAALLFAVAPASVYYGRTFMPDSVMLFFSTGVLYFWWRWLTGSTRSDFMWAVIFGALAWLAKPPALILLVPVVALLFARARWRAFAKWRLYAFLGLTLAPLSAYLSYVGSIARWHWTTGITGKHVLPLLAQEFSTPANLWAGAISATALVHMLATTVLGPFLFGLALFAWAALPHDQRTRNRAWLFGAWFAALAAYTFVVVNYERVDYYLLLWLPLGALLAGGALDNVWSRITGDRRLAAGTWAGLAVALFFVVYSNILEIAPYYEWNRAVYAAAKELDRTLTPGALVVMGHYSPAILYLANRKGWEEDPALWTVHDQKSAMRKGARYFIAFEVARLKTNAPLYRFLQGYPHVLLSSGLLVYDLHH